MGLTVFQFESSAPGLRGWVLPVLGVWEGLSWFGTPTSWSCRHHPCQHSWTSHQYLHLVPVGIENRYYVIVKITKKIKLNKTRVESVQLEKTGSEKSFVFETFWLQKNLGKKMLSFEKMFVSEKVWSEIDSLASRCFYVEKSFWSTKFFGPKKLSVYKFWL